MAIINGAGSNDSLTGTDDADLIDGGGGNDALYGLDGHDRLWGAVGDDYLEGGAGSDRLVGGAGSNTLLGGDGNDIFDIAQGEGADYVDGGAGNNALDYYYSPYDLNIDLRISAPQVTNPLLGTDTILNISGVYGGNGHDLLTGTSIANALSGGAGNDTLVGLDGDDEMQGGEGNDTLIGGQGDDQLDGITGSDTASYVDATSSVTVDLDRSGADTGAGLDTFRGIDNLAGSNFDDWLGGDLWDNALSGGGGDDFLAGELGDDTLNGGAGVDAADYSTASSYVTVDLRYGGGAQNTDGAGSDTLVSIENVVGSAYDDRIWGDNGANSLQGLGGDDQLDGGLGNDTLDGGSGFDTANYGSATSYVTIDLDYGSVQNTDAAGLDTFASIERVIGGNYDDRFWGSDANNFLHGGIGQDQLNGRGGEDLLDGGANHDILTGGSGPDVFVFRSTSDTHWDAPDRITDFAPGDRIDIGDIDADTSVGGDQAFHIAVTPEAAGVYITYDAGSNRTTLRLDTNGDGNPEGRIWLDGDHRGLTNADFVL